MRIQKHPNLPLWCREDGAICMPPYPNNIDPKLHKFRWTYGYPNKHGYFRIGFLGKQYKVHRLMAETFLENPLNLPTVDHISRNKSDNRADNLRWADRKMQQDNRQVCKDSKAKYGVRWCEDKKSYWKAYRVTYYAEHRDEIISQKAAYYSEHCEEIKAQKVAYRAKQKALGKRERRCPDGKRRMLTDQEFAAMFP